MGRQINFVHSEIDSIDFLNEIEKRSCKLLDGKCFEIVEDAETIVLKQMQSEQCRFYIAPGLDASQMQGTIPKPRLIEFDNCYKGNEPQEHMSLADFSLRRTAAANMTRKRLEHFKAWRRISGKTMRTARKAACISAKTFYQNIGTSIILP